MSIFAVGKNPQPVWKPIGAIPAEEQQTIREEAITLAAQKVLREGRLEAIAALEKKENKRTAKEELAIFLAVLVILGIGMLLMPVAGLIAGVLIGVIGFACSECQRGARLERGRKKIDECFNEAALERLKQLIAQEWSKTHLTES